MKKICNISRTNYFNQCNSLNRSKLCCFNNDKDLIGTKLSSRYSGEYIHFGKDENNLYRIVSHETEGLTKIVSAASLKDTGTFKTIAFGDNTTYSSTNTVGAFLNGEYLSNYVGANSNMIEDSTTWYLGTVVASYKLAKYTDINMSNLTSSTINAKVGLLRLGKLMSGQFDSGGNNASYWTLTPYSSSDAHFVYSYGSVLNDSPTRALGVRPSLNLKSNIIMTSGEGTKEKPFEITLGN